MEIENLTIPLQNKIFYFGMVHPCAEMIKKPKLPKLKVGTCIFCKKNGRKLYPELFSSYLSTYISDTLFIMSCICKSCYQKRYYIDVDESVVITSFNPPVA